MKLIDLWRKWLEGRGHLTYGQLTRLEADVIERRAATKRAIALDENGKIDLLLTEWSLMMLESLLKGQRHGGDYLDTEYRPAAPPEAGERLD